MSAGTRLDAMLGPVVRGATSLRWHLAAYWSGARPWRQAPHDLVDVLAAWEHATWGRVTDAMDRLTDLHSEATMVAHDQWVRTGRIVERRRGIGPRSPEAFFRAPAHRQPPHLRHEECTCPPVEYCDDVEPDE